MKEHQFRISKEIHTEGKQCQCRKCGNFAYSYIRPYEGTIFKDFTFTRVVCNVPFRRETTLMQEMQAAISKEIRKIEVEKY